MRPLALLLMIGLQDFANATSMVEISEWLVGTWRETKGSCPTTLIFSSPDKVSIKSENAESTGSYSLSKAVGMSAESVCLKQQCYQMGFTIYYTEHKNGCGERFELGKHDAYLNNFHRLDRDHLIWGEGIVFERIKQV